MKDWTTIPIEDVKPGDIVDAHGVMVEIHYHPVVVNGNVHLASRNVTNVVAPVGTKIEVYR